MPMAEVLLAFVALPDKPHIRYERVVHRSVRSKCSNPAVPGLTEPDHDLAHVRYAGNGLNDSRHVTLGLSESVGFRSVLGGNYSFGVLCFGLIRAHHVLGFKRAFSKIEGNDSLVVQT